MIKELWKRHYSATSGNYHCDMARAFQRMMDDSKCGEINRVKLRHTTEIHMQLERDPSYEGRKWFCEVFGKPEERVEVL